MTYELKIPPSDIANGKPLKKWYRINVGYLPTDWRSRVGVQVKKDLSSPSPEQIKAALRGWYMETLRDRLIGAAITELADKQSPQR